MTIGWPARLTSGEITLRPVSRSDAPAWREIRARNAEWLKPWDATVPPGGDSRPTSYPALVRRLRRMAARRRLRRAWFLMRVRLRRGIVTCSVWP